MWCHVFSMQCPMFVTILVAVVTTTPVLSGKWDRAVNEKPLSDKIHNDELDHDYDHEAFLGDDADDYDDLSPEESKRRLSLIVAKIDVNNDEQVSVEELQNWIKKVHNRCVGWGSLYALMMTKGC